MQQLDGHVSATGTGARHALRLTLFGMAMLLTISAAAALPLLLLG